VIPAVRSALGAVAGPREVLLKPARRPLYDGRLTMMGLGPETRAANRSPLLIPFPEDPAACPVLLLTTSLIGALLER
jgi:hypothetical protein